MTMPCEQCGPDRVDFQWMREGGDRCERGTVWEGEWRWQAIRTHAVNQCSSVYENLEKTPGSLGM